jgi:hypothetical protein
MDTPTPKKFPIGKLRELHKHVAAMHAHLTNLIADWDGTARDDSDASEPYAQGQDSATPTAQVIAAAIVEARNTMTQDEFIARARDRR